MRHLWEYCASTRRCTMIRKFSPGEIELILRHTLLLFFLLSNILKERTNSSIRRFNLRLNYFLSGALGLIYYFSSLRLPAPTNETDKATLTGEPSTSAQQTDAG